MGQPTPAAAGGPDIQVLGGVAQGPDGKPWAVLELRFGIMRTTLLMPHQIADQFAETIPGILREVAATARRAEMGLIVPTPATPPVNGHPHQ